MPLYDSLCQLRDLVAGCECAGCRVPSCETLCHRCRAQLASVQPVLASPGGGGVRAYAAGEYAGLLRRCLLSYKERRRRDLAWTLARLAAQALLAGWPAVHPVVFVPIPATRQAFRQRGFDHVGLLCRRLMRLVPGSGVVAALRARSRPDSAGLSLSQRRAAAETSLRARPVLVSALRRERVGVLLVDDIVTSGATFAAASAVLREAGLTVDGAVAVAATSPRFPRKSTGSRR